MGQCLIALVAACHPEYGQRLAQATLVAQPAPQGYAAASQYPRRREIALKPGEIGRATQSPGAHRVGLQLFRRQGLLEPAAAFNQVTAQVPKAPQAAAQLRGDIVRSMGQAPG